MRPTGPHPLRARELTTPHPESLTTRPVPVEVDLKEQIFDVCSSLNNGHSPKGGNVSFVPSITNFNKANARTCPSALPGAAEVDAVHNITSGVALHLAVRPPHFYAECECLVAQLRPAFNYSRM